MCNNDNLITVNFIRNKIQQWKRIRNNSWLSVIESLLQSVGGHHGSCKTHQAGKQNMFAC